MKYPTLLRARHHQHLSRLALPILTLLGLTAQAVAPTLPRVAPPLPRAAPTLEFRIARPGYRYEFPRDHGAHPDFQTEWWYFTGHLQSQGGRRYGYQITFFRTALTPRLKNRASRWAVRDLIFAHLALTDKSNGRFFYADRISRTALNLAGCDLAGTPSPRVWLGPWRLRFEGPNGARQTLRAATNRGDEASSGISFGLELTQRALKPATLQGQNGVSQKAAGLGHASHYYSLTRLATTGTVRIGGERLAVSGQSWFDHEFGTNQLTPQQAGWDWFSLQLDDGRELMLYRMRLKNGGDDPFSSGTLIERDGRSRHLTLSEMRIETLGTWRSPQSGTLYPARWRVSLPREDLQLEVTPTVADQELITRRSTGITYWEGSVGATGTQRGRSLQGAGYVELTGYTRALGNTF